MPTTRKKVIKTVYKDEDDSEVEDPYSDSGSEAQISEQSSSEDEIYDHRASSGDDFVSKKPQKTYTRTVKKTKFAKTFVNKLNKQTMSRDADNDQEPAAPAFSIKDLTDEDKLLPSVLNLSESDSSEDESPKLVPEQAKTMKTIYAQNQGSDSDSDDKSEYKDVWFNNTKDESEEIAKKAFLELEKHKSKVEETKASLYHYSNKLKANEEYDVQDLLAQGEEVLPKKPTTKKKIKLKNIKEDSDSEMEDWEEVKESKSIPQQGLQLIVDLPNAVCRKTKKIDVEMMMKRKINRVKKEYQVYMHKVHVLCWLGHGNYVSKVLNNQELLAASLTLVPSKECYPGERVDMKYLEQIATWYKDKLTFKQDKNENKFRPKAPPLKDLLISQINSRVVTTRKYLVYIFVCMLRALGLQCRVMFNFVTLPLKPPTSELCSLSTKPKHEQKSTEGIKNELKSPDKNISKRKTNEKIPQVDGVNDNDYYIHSNIAQLDGNDDSLQVKTRTRKSNTTKSNEGDVSPPKRSRRTPSPRNVNNLKKNSVQEMSANSNKKTELKNILVTKTSKVKDDLKNNISIPNNDNNAVSPRKTRSKAAKSSKTNLRHSAPKIVVTEIERHNSRKYFDETKKAQENKAEENKSLSNLRKRSRTAVESHNESEKSELNSKSNKSRTKSAPGPSVEKSKYFGKGGDTSPPKKQKLSVTKAKASSENAKRVSHRDLAKTRTSKSKNDVTGDLVHLIKGRIHEAKQESKKGIVKGKSKIEEDYDSDYLPEETPRHKSADSDEDFKPSKISPKPSTSKNKKIDRRVLSSDEDTAKNRLDVWCEVFVEELEQWIPVDVIKGTVHCAENIYTRATHPVCYIVGWDNNNYLKDLTRRYVPHWNTVTRKQRAETIWWNKAVQPWLGPKNARDREEDEQLDRMQLEAPLPKSIAEYKNHPLYALKRHLLKYEALYPPNPAVLGLVRKEPVYARECVYVCRSRDTWLKEAKVVKLGEQPYKVVKARPKWDKLSNKLITDKPLEIFGPWQVQDYEPPVAENGIVPRNAYGNVELFKDCMLPKGTVHIKLPGLNKVAKKLNIDCAPAMTGFDFNGGWSHPVYDGFVVCKEFEEIITQAWVEDQEEQERREIEKTEARVYGHWRRLIKGLLIRERLKNKYGFEEPSTSQDIKKSKGPRLVVKKK